MAHPPKNKEPRGGRVDLVITCTFTARWVASKALYRFQLPAADSSREACEPRLDPASRITKCGLKKDLSRTPQGTIHTVSHLWVKCNRNCVRPGKFSAGDQDSSSSSLNSSSMNSS